MIKGVLRNWHRYVLWALMSVIVWSWIFTLLFAAPAKKKVVLYAQLPSIDSHNLSIYLEEETPEAVRFIESATFEGELFDPREVLKGDLYLIPEPNMEQYYASFAPIDKSAFPDETFWEIDGKAYGILISDPSAGFAVGSDYLTYYEDVRCYLCFNKDSLHLGAWNDTADDAAIPVAKRFLTLR